MTIFDPKLDLVLERTVDVAPALVWAAWTEPEHVMKWFTPKPWRTTECAIDLRPGGLFRTVMEGPNGERNVNVGCYLEIVPNRRLVWTDALHAGWRPAGDLDKRPLCQNFTAIIELEGAGRGTRYKATSLHPDEATRQRHEEMGFHEGWGTALDQLVAHAKTM